MAYGSRSSLFMGCCVAMVCACLLFFGCEKQPAGEKPAEQDAAENQTTQMKFQDLFDVNGNMVTPKFIIRYGSTTMTPAVPFESQVMRIDDVPFTEYIGHDAEVKREGEVYRIIRFN